MSGKPTQQEEEYFARLEFEQRTRSLAERVPRRIPAMAEDTSFLGSLRRIFTYS